ncbi:MAG: hypothetical protein ACLP7P_08605 [Rhodomicrobium sp.]
MYDFASMVDTSGRSGSIWGGVAKQNALAAAGQQYQDDPEGAINALLSRGLYADADALQKRSDASDLADAYTKAAASAPAGQNPGVTALIGAGQPGQAVNLQNVYNAQTNQANIVADRRKAAAQELVTQLANAARFAQTPELYGQIMAQAKAMGYDTTGYEDFNTGRPMLMARAGVAPDVLRAQNPQARGAIAQEADIKARQFIAQHPEYQSRLDEVRGMAMTAAQAGDDLAIGPSGEVKLAGLSGSRAGQRQQAVDALTRRSSPEGIAENTYAKTSAASNAQVQASRNRLVSVLEQIDNMKGFAGPENTQQRNTFESSIGWFNSKSGREFYDGQLPWGDPDVPEVMFNLRAATHLLQDELSQYVQAKGSSSDTRAANAFAAIGDLWNSPDAKTFVGRLNFLEKQLKTIKDAPFVNPTAFPWKSQVGTPSPAAVPSQAAPQQAQTAPAPAQDVPVLTPEQARSYPAGKPYRTTDGRVLVR